jgi:hypothetical protein
MPVIVGSPRSGTTLLRLMLDAHPDLAIPPETGFFTLPPSPDAAHFVEAIRAFPHASPAWPDFQVDAQALERELAALPAFDMAAGFRGFYRHYARRFGKSRWGDKTPMYARHLPAIARLLPEARFVHLVRDGRDAAVSLRRQWFSPGADIGVQARFWLDNVSAAIADSAGVPHYLEVRFESLVRDPERELRRVCDFIELEFDAAMLRHDRVAAARLREHAGRELADGRSLSAEDRRRQQASSAKAPDPAAIGRWKTALDASEQACFARIAGALLQQLGYDRTP